MASRDVIISSQFAARIRRGFFTSGDGCWLPITSAAQRSENCSATSVLCQKNSRRLELSISQNTPHGRWGQGPGSVDPRFPAGLPCPVPEFLKFVAFPGSGKFFRQVSRDFPRALLGNPRTDPGNSHSLLEPSDCGMFRGVGFRTC